METRQLLRTDLPKYRSAGNSLHIPVLLSGKKRYVCDIHFGDANLCWLEKAKGVPTKIAKLKLITDERSAESVRKEIERLTEKYDELQEKARKIGRETMTLRVLLRKLTK